MKSSQSFALSPKSEPPSTTHIKKARAPDVRLFSYVLWQAELLEIALLKIGLSPGIACSLRQLTSWVACSFGQSVS